MTGLYADTRSPSAAIVASSAALSIVLPTPVSVPVTNSPRIFLRGRSGGADDRGLALGVEEDARGDVRHGRTRLALDESRGGLRLLRALLEIERGERSVPGNARQHGAGLFETDLPVHWILLEEGRTELGRVQPDPAGNLGEHARGHAQLSGRVGGQHGPA